MEETERRKRVVCVGVCACVGVCVCVRVATLADGLRRRSCAMLMPHLSNGSLAASSTSTLSSLVSSCHSAAAVAAAVAAADHLVAASSSSTSSLSSSSSTSLPAPVPAVKDTTFTKIFVGGLPYHTTDASLRDHFHVYGEIDEAVVITDRQTGKSRGYGFVRVSFLFSLLSFSFSFSFRLPFSLDDATVPTRFIPSPWKRQLH